MADNKDINDGRDRSKVSASDDYEVQHFATANGISPEQVRELIAKHGNNREELEKAAKRL